MHHRPRQAVLAAVVLAAAGRSAVGQANNTPDEGPVVVGERKEDWKAVQLNTLGAAIEVDSWYRAEQSNQEGQPDLSATELRLREYLDLNFGVFLGHKNLVDFTGTAKLGLQQLSLDSNQSGDTRENETTDLYNLNALFLASSFVPTSIYTRRDETLLDRGFAGSVDAVTNETGIVSNIRSEVAPTTIRLYHLEYDQSDLLGETSSSLTQNTAAINSNILIGPNHNLDITAEFDQISETQNSTFENNPDRIDTLFADTYTWGSGLNQLHSYLRYYSEAGQFAYETLRWDEQMTLTHSDRLETRYNTVVERLTRDDIDQSLARGDFNIRHRLFDSLISNANMGGQYLTTSEDFSSSDLFLTGSMEYTKLAGPGRVDSSVSAGVNLQENSERGGTVNVVDEPHTYNPPFPIVLPRRNIVEGSIVMTAVGGFPTYQEGPDYTVQYFPDRAEVTIVPGRGILIGQTLIFDYELGPEPGSTINTLATGVTFRYTFTETWARGFSMYTSYRTRNSNVDSPDPDAIVLDNTNILLYGAEYRRAGLTLRAEQEMRDSNVNPYNTTRLQAIYDLILGPASVLNADLTYDIIDYQDPSSTVTFGRISVRWDQRLTDTLNMTFRVEAYNDDDDTTGSSLGLAEHFEIRWRYRQTLLYAELHNTNLTTDTSDTASQAFELGFRREF